MFIAELDGAPAGCAFLVTLVDYFNERPHAHLSVLAVSSRPKAKGVGSALLDRSRRMGAGTRLGSPDAERAGHQRPRPRALRAQGIWRRIHSVRSAALESGYEGLGHES